MLMAVLTKMIGTEATTGYNIMMGLVYAMGAQACFGLGSNLVGLARGKDRPAWGWGLLAAAFLMFLGNLAPLRQVLRDGLLPLGAKEWPFHVDWPATARMVYDPMPDGRLLDILTEYPVYSYLNGDLHAHLLGAPYVLLALGYILHLFVAPGRWAMAAPTWRAVQGFLAGGLFIGALYLINGGDFPIYLFMVVVVLALVESRAGGGWQAVLGRWALQLVGFGVALYLVYFFYFTNFTGMIRGKPLPDVADTPVLGFLSKYVGWISWPRTFLMEYGLMYGLFLLPILTLLALKLSQVGRTERREVPVLSGGWRWLVRLVGLVLVLLALLGLTRTWADFAQKNLSLYSLVLPLAAGSVGLLALLNWQALRQRPRLTLEGLFILLLTAIGPLVQFELLGLVAGLLYFALRLGWRERQQAASWQSRLDLFFCVCVALAAGITLFCELVYVRDIYSNRFNTMFKFWYQIWNLYGFAGVYGIWRVVSWGRAEVLISTETTSSLSRGRLAPALGGLAALFRHGRQPLADGPKLNSYMQNQSGSDTLSAGSNFGEAEQASFTGANSTDVAATEEAFTRTDVSGTASNERVRVAAGLAVPDRPTRRAWKRVWLAGLVFLMFSALAVPTLAYWQATGGYAQRQGLNGEYWYSQAFPDEYPAMRWLRDYTRKDPSRRGIVLEGNGMNYSWGDRISTFTGLPTIVGWPFHELQWRGYLPEIQIWEAWLDMDRIYETTDVEQAKLLLKRHDVRYVFVGQAENGSRSLFSDNSKFKQFSPEALAKFRTFMKPIYEDPSNNVYIYAFE